MNWILVLMVVVCVIWSFDDMGLGEQVILSDKESKGGLQYTEITRSNVEHLVHGINNPQSLHNNEVNHDKSI